VMTDVWFAYNIFWSLEMNPIVRKLVSKFLDQSFQ
jgi:hypothetical protein